MVTEPRDIEPISSVDTRTRIVFAWLPVRLHDGTWCRWASYIAEETFEPDCSGWATGHWTIRARYPLP